MVSLRAVALSCVTLLCVVAACNDDDPAPEPLTCTSAGEARCGDTCVSLASDPDHCGGCDTACANIEACVSGACVAVCQIDGQQVTTGTRNPANACEQCEPGTSPSTWTALANGAQCGAGQVCSAGACGSNCFIDGVLQASGAVNPANTCEVCTPAASTTAWASADGKQCGAGQVCSAGACASMCFIDGVLQASGASNPANACEQCAPATSSTAWSARSDGAQCGAGQVCSAGACGAQCFIDGALHASGSRNPANPCEVCTPATSTTAWSAAVSIPLLVGGTDLAAQGWTTIAQAPNTLDYGEDYVRLSTATPTGGRTSGQLLITKARAFDATKPFKLQVTLQVEAVTRHNQLDSGAAILGSFTSPAGSSTDRAQMIYLDSTAIGWADDSQAAAFPVVDGAYHVYELAVDAAKVATVSVDGTMRLTRNNFTTNGTIALGDQTNDANVDGTLRIRSVELFCSP
jgi:hypothetical protein